MNIEIDEGLYSRQLYVVGKEGMKKMSQCNVLISGLNGLGLEIAKNIVLAGVKSVTLHDPEVITYQDLSSHFYACQQDIGSNRAEVSLANLAQLNSHVTVKVAEVNKYPLTADLIGQHQIVVLAGSFSLQASLEISDHCRAHACLFILASTHGLCGQVFCDCGPEYLITDPTGEELKQIILENIDCSPEGVVTCTPEMRHGFDDSTYVTFSGIEGMVELNECQPRRVTVCGPYKFSIGDTSHMSPYSGGGICREVRMPQPMHFKSMRESIECPALVISDYAKMSRPRELHLLFKAADTFKASHSGRLPRAWNEVDADAFLEIVRNENERHASTDCWVKKLDEQFIKLFAFTSSGNLSPIQSIIGGIASQEVMKFATGRFQPLHQWLYLDALECLPSDTTISESDACPRDSRYDGQIAVFGSKFQEHLNSLNYFVVGAGAIGCELLKNFATMGLGCGPRGKLVVTDMDFIERSNLNRQFLFRPSDIGKPKSLTAANAVRVMNPELSIEAQENRIGTESESVYDQAFFESLDGVANALDNVETRLYMDRRCVLFRKPMIDSGTLGTRGHVQVVVPDLTEHYGARVDVQEKAIPICTLRNFPYLIQHTIQWAREMFDTLFTEPGLAFDKWKQTGGAAPTDTDLLEHLHTGLTDRPSTFSDCVRWARLLWEQHYSSTIRQLLHNFPPEHRTRTGVPFWSGTKRCPTPLTFSASNVTHLDFIVSAANLRAAMFALPQVHDRALIVHLVSSITVPQFQPKEGVRIAVTDAELEQMIKEEAACDVGTIPPLAEVTDQILHSLQFEKDDDTNFHMDFITAASNLRADTYNIEQADRLETKKIAGRIIPAIASTTAVVVGLVCLEIIKLAHGHRELSQYKNWYFNLAIPAFTPTEPVRAPPNLWNRIEIPGDPTLQQLIDYFKRTRQLQVTGIYYNVAILFTADNIKEDRLNMKLSELVSVVTKKPLGHHDTLIKLLVSCVNASGDDVDLPDVVCQLSRL